MRVSLYRETLVYIQISLYSESFKYRDMLIYGYEFCNCEFQNVKIHPIRRIKTRDTWRVARWRHFAQVGGGLRFCIRQAVWKYNGHSSCPIGHPASSNKPNYDLGHLSRT